ncbi:MAG TPA: hypothetical protein VJT75_14010 [Thermoleophilaceae bacterium]|nr:hypothetical protein [Thermoleophilaceae bacterium]
MAVPRPVLLALLGLGLLASVFLVTRNGSNESVKSSTAPLAKPAVTPTAPDSGKSGKGAASKKAEAHKAAPADAKERKGAGDKAATKKAAAKPAGKGAAGKAAAAGGVDGRVLRAARALGEDKAVVFFFSKPGAADDVGARVAMKSLRGMDRVEIFDASLDELAAYRPMLANVGISQIPSTVIVRPGKKAILIQGFVDAGTLRQNVADALR